MLFNNQYYSLVTRRLWHILKPTHQVVAVLIGSALQVGLLSPVDFCDQSLHLELNLFFEQGKFFCVLLLIAFGELGLLLNLLLDLLDFLAELRLHFDCLAPPLLVVFTPFVQVVQVCFEQGLLAVQDLPFEREQGMSELTHLLGPLLLQLRRHLMLLQHTVDL